MLLEKWGVDKNFRCNGSAILLYSLELAQKINYITAMTKLKLYTLEDLLNYYNRTAIVVLLIIIRNYKKCIVELIILVSYLIQSNDPQKHVNYISTTLRSYYNIMFMAFDSF